MIICIYVYIHIYVYIYIYIERERYTATGVGDSPDAPCCICDGVPLQCPWQQRQCTCSSRCIY